MAKNTGTSADENSINREAPPDGFSIPVGRNRGDGWVMKHSGGVVHGKLLGMYTMKKLASDGKSRKYFQVELLRGCQAVQTLGEDDEGYDEDAEDGNRVEVMLEPGQVMNVDISVALRDLEPYFTDGNTYDIWFQYIRQDAKFRKMWRLEGPHLKRTNK